MPPLIPYDVVAAGTAVRAPVGAPPWPRLRGGWTTTNAGTESIGQQRLRALRHLAGSGLWRTARLLPSTVETAVKFLLAFEGVDRRLPPPRIAPVDDGSIMMEWEHALRELLVEVGPADRIDVLLVEAGAETRDGAAAVAEASDLARWLSGARE